jgi:hypothetical protein
MAAEYWHPVRESSAANEKLAEWGPQAKSRTTIATVICRFAALRPMNE